MCGYQGRKECKTSNLLLITDSQGIPLACSEPISGQHNDAFELSLHIDQMLKDIGQSSIRTEYLFLNADAGFDVESFRVFCFENDIIANIKHNPKNNKEATHLFDELLYKCRFVIERTNAWLDALKALLVRFETNQIHWNQPP